MTSLHHNLLLRFPLLQAFFLPIGLQRERFATSSIRSEREQSCPPLCYPPVRISRSLSMESATSQIATSVAMGAWQVHAFFRNLKNPDPTVNLFVSGLESLAVACEAVGELFKERTDQREEQLQQLWECLESRLRACNDTISQLELAVDCAKLGKKDKSPFGRMIRQVRTNGKPKEVEAARSEIHTHTTCLQMILHVARM